MSSQRYPPEFEDEAVRQVLERGCTVAEVSQRLGVSAHSLYDGGARPREVKNYFVSEPLCACSRSARASASESQLIFSGKPPVYQTSFACPGHSSPR
ncbi:hypothetical protein, HTH_fis: Helix-turn-helix domain, fis-type [Marinobacter nauticus ATCC 49840]|nr:hypothetical protein, HTH_fis: Helix-turn-helix domain, fis-type [Marinobacter nauticus ATCC 49840]